MGDANRGTTRMRMGNQRRETVAREPGEREAEENERREKELIHPTTVRDGKQGPPARYRQSTDNNNLPIANLNLKNSLRERQPPALGRAPGQVGAEPGRQDDAVVVATSCPRAATEGDERTAKSIAEIARRGKDSDEPRSSQSRQGET